MVGEVSQGMLFDIGYADNITPCLAVPEIPVPNGSIDGAPLRERLFWLFWAFGNACLNSKISKALNHRHP